VPLYDQTQIDKRFFIVTHFSLIALNSYDQTKPNKYVVVQTLDFDLGQLFSAIKN
jgi:hypothetical protein